jgi:D-sedoheptulose 7-phosphate isomerase
MSTPSQSISRFVQAIRDHQAAIEQLEQQQALFEQIATRMIESLRQGRKILWCGNGGSAAECQHLAAELVGRFRRERRGWPSIALTTDTSILTAIGNDYGYEHVFRRQVEALCQPGDVLVGLSTSGNSPNVCTAVRQARSMDVFTVGMSGPGGGELARSAHLCLCVPSRDTARIQECHMLFGHMLCDRIESELAG